MLTERDFNPLPIYRVIHDGRYVQFFHNYDNAVAYIDNCVFLGFDRNAYTIDEGF
jgi:hypothetical protein